MKKLIQVTGDNGNVPPAFSRSCTLSFMENATVQLAFYREQENGKKLQEGLLPYTRQALEQLMEKLATAPLRNAQANMVGGETRQVTDLRSTVPLTYNIYADDPAGIALYEQFLALCDPQLPARIKQFFDSGFDDLQV